MSDVVVKVAFAALHLRQQAQFDRRIQRLFTGRYDYGTAYPKSAHCAQVG